MSDIQIIPYNKKDGRVETGPVQFGEDWPGLFVRGDNCMGIMMDVMILEYALQDNKDFQVNMALRNLRSMFSSPIPTPPRLEKSDASDQN